MYMLLSIDWLFILHCILCFSAFLLQFSRSPGMKRAHRQSKVFKSSEGHTKQQNAEVALWSWKESAGIRRPGPDGNSMYCLLLRKAEGKRTPVCMLGELSRARSDTKIQTVSHVWTAYEWTKRSQDDSVYCMLWQSSPVPALICFSTVEVYRAGPDLRLSVIQVCWRWSWGLNSALGSSAVWPCDWSTPLPV